MKYSDKRNVSKLKHKNFNLRTEMTNRRELFTTVKIRTSHPELLRAKTGPGGRCNKCQNVRWVQCVCYYHKGRDYSTVCHTVQCMQYISRITRRIVSIFRLQGWSFRLWSCFRIEDIAGQSRISGLGWWLRWGHDPCGTTRFPTFRNYKHKGKSTHSLTPTLSLPSPFRLCFLDEL